MGQCVDWEPGWEGKAGGTQAQPRHQSQGVRLALGRVIRERKFLERARAGWVDKGAAVASICRVDTQWRSLLDAQAHDERREGVVTLVLLCRVAQNFKNVEVRAVLVVY